ncbi:DUF1542 domain-containing protein [Streptococcus pseudopneumoniae]|uniref:DUF1542 domain-containing protein n=1 Tax=Streptococcus pseudopneumoniae TaxID=257758 RepID=UPI001C65A37D|nr:DUF1542 domain-containing protein [Streptococcus pseudopneumoniae]MBW8145315.1 DUF1542 domain-containing protein [Streptococcus pseudopneumoniae]
MFYSEKDDREKQLRFSIRKVSFGAASVAVAALYLFMGSGAVSAAEAQAVQSNEEVAADKDSETEEQQPTYAAPAAKEQGSATNTEAGDEGKQESHPGTKEEEVNSSERSETTTKTQSDEDSVSGDSSSPKSEGEGTRSEEASRKPKVRKRRDAPASTATPTDDDSDENQTYEAPGDDASVDDLATKLKALPETVENEKKLAKIDEVAATKNIAKGQVSELNEFGGWKAVAADGTAGKFAVARKTDRGVFPLETVNTVRTIIGRNYYYDTYVKEQAFDRTNDYVLFLSKVRTLANKEEETFDGRQYQENNEGNIIAKGVKGFNGIEKTFKAYSSETGSTVKIAFKTGYSGDINGTKAKYKVEVMIDENGMKRIIYTKTFSPTDSSNDGEAIITSAKDGNKTEYLRNEYANKMLNKELVEEKMAEEANKPNGTPGTFTSKNIVLPKGVTDYTVRISSADNQHLGMGYQSPHKHYALPIAGTGFAVTQDTSEVAKDLSQKVYNKLIQQKAEDTKWSTPETKAAYEEKLQKIKEKIDSGASTSEYKTVVAEALEKQRQLDEGQEIKDKAKEAVDAKLKEKAAEIDKNDKLSPSEKDKAKEAAKKAAEDAKQAIMNASSQGEVTNSQDEGTKAIGDVNPIGTENAVNAIADAAARKMAAIDDDETLSEDEKKAAKEKVEEAAIKAAQAIKKAKDAKNQGGVDKAQEDAISEVNAINPIGKDKAKKAIADKLKEKEEAIDNNNKLSPREKAAAKDQAKQAADRAKEAITNALTQDEVNKQETEGTTAINNVNPIGTDMAVDAIAEAAARRMAEIDDDETLSEDEKSIATEEVVEAVRKAGEAIRKAKEAKNQDDVDKAQADGIAAIAAVNPVAKDKAKEAVAAKLKEKEAEIDNNNKLSPAEKETAKEAAKKAAEDAIQAIKDAQTQDDVNMKEAEGTAAIGNVNPVAKDKAKEAVAAKLKEKEAEIDANANFQMQKKQRLRNKLKRQRTKLSKPSRMPTLKLRLPKRKLRELKL